MNSRFANYLILSSIRKQRKVLLKIWRLPNGQMSGSKAQTQELISEQVDFSHYSALTISQKSATSSSRWWSEVESKNRTSSWQFRALIWLALWCHTFTWIRTWMCQAATWESELLEQISRLSVILTRKARVHSLSCMALLSCTYSQCGERWQIRIKVNCLPCLISRLMELWTQSIEYWAAEM